MAVVEGHASYVERLAVESIYPTDTWWRIRGRHLVERPRGLLSGLLNVLFATKRDQYKQGMRFVADAAHAILTKPSSDCTGNFLVDDDVLRAEGITDLSGYAVDPSQELQVDLFVEGDDAAFGL